MFKSSKIKLDTTLYEKATSRAEALGYNTVDEYIAHLVENDLTATETAPPGDENREKILAKMKGLGYLE